MKQEPLKESLSLSVTDLSVMVLLKTLLLLAALSTTSCTPNTPAQSNTFTINLPREIHSVDPLLLRGTAKRYVLFNVHRGLFFYDAKSKLKNHGASACKWTEGSVYQCRLNSRKWSDGSPILAKHYVYTFQQIKKLSEESSVAITDLKDVIAVDDMHLNMVFTKKIKDINHRLSSLTLSPRNKNQTFSSLEGQLFSGPYKVKSLTKKRIHLQSNSHYDNHKRPDVKGVFIDDPSAALNMYEAGNLSFLRYLESSNVKAYDNVLFAPFAKLDGLFINSKKLSENARQALLLSLDFTNLQKLYNNPASPGCLALPKSFFKSEIDCLKFDLEAAKKLYVKSELSTLKLKIHIPNADTDEHKKMALWAQSEWLKNLNLKVQVEIVETKMFYDGVKKSAYTIYRKAHSLDNLGCTDAVGSLSRENEFSSLSLDQQKNCRNYFKAALDLNNWAPLGMPYYAHLPSKKFSGYYINLLGQFGLEGLRINK